MSGPAWSRAALEVLKRASERQRVSLVVDAYGLRAWRRRYSPLQPYGDHRARL
jgi:hypothetical protein